MRAWAGLVSAVLLAACADAPSYPTVQATPTPAAPPAAEPAPAAAASSLLATPAPSSRELRGVAGPDACGATRMQGMVGRSRTLIPVPLDPNRQRVACTTCPAAADVDPARLNFLFDADTGVIRQVRCG